MKDDLMTILIGEHYCNAWSLEMQIMLVLAALHIEMRKPAAESLQHASALTSQQLSHEQQCCCTCPRVGECSMGDFATRRPFVIPAIPSALTARA